MNLDQLPGLCYVNSCRRISGHDGAHDPYPAEAWGHFDEKDCKKLTKAGFATPRGGAKGAYQNHVVRSNRVIIPYEFLDKVDLNEYKNGWVIRLFPHQYFVSAGKPHDSFSTTLKWIVVGKNAFVLYRTHDSFDDFPPPNDWNVRSLRKNEKEVAKRGNGVEDVGEYVVRLPTLSKKKASRIEGPPQGLFATEYADEETNYLCKCVLAWLIIQTVDSPYTLENANHLRSILRHEELGDLRHFELVGIVRNGLTQCPLCLRSLRYCELHDTVAFEDESGLENAAHQVEGSTRSTVVNLFHLRPLFYHALVHVPKNVAWGHAVCNTRLGQRPCYSLAEIVEMGRKIGFVRDQGIETFGWMSEDDTMIRSDAGAVWIQIASAGTVGPPKSTEVVVDSHESQEHDVSASA